MVAKSPEYPLEFRSVSVRYGERVALRDISLRVPRHSIFAIFGPANSGKSTLLKCINRTLELTESSVLEGTILIDGIDTRTIANVHSLRKRVGMVFPLPVGLPLSIFENVAFTARRAGIHNATQLEERVERFLRQAMLWDEVKDRLHSLGTKLSGGQQQRLTLARALSQEPDILCLDEFSIAIDPITTMRIEEILRQLKESMTIVMVTNLTQQAYRLADQVLFLNASRMIEIGATDSVFQHPQQAMTHDYLTGVFG